ncbi:MAG TPA: biopolymer transporter ExbD [Luteibaculaceae bacterium]|nr:biopolymer transporter ExbD [Luteibaculaceae bacterium]
MKIKRSKRFAAEVSTASLNDIMFFLLLFFLIISTLANPNVIKIMLPKAGSTQTINKQPLTLSITEDKNYFIDNRAVLFEELENELIAYSGQTTDPTIILRLSSNLNVQDMVDVMSLCSKHKLKMVLATEKVGK